MKTVVVWEFPGMEYIYACGFNPLTLKVFFHKIIHLNASKGTRQKYKTADLIQVKTYLY